MSWLLSERLGYHHTLSLFTKENGLSAARARRAGLVDAVVEHADLAVASSFWCEIAALASTRAMSKSLVRSATESRRRRATVMEEFAASSR
jgi:enoyl-CoA hydratase/carnithine racemase